MIRNIFSGDAEADAFDKFKDLGLKTSFEERIPERVKRKRQKKIWWRKSGRKRTKNINPRSNAY